MNDYIKANLPEHHAAIEVALQKSREATLERAKADAAQQTADSAYREAWVAAQQATLDHFAANTQPSGAVVPADLLARIAGIINIPSLQWAVRLFWDKVARGAAGTVATAHRGGRVVLLVRLYMVEAPHHADPRWGRVATLEIWSHSGTIAGSGGRKRVVSEEDCAALMALGHGEVTT